VSRVKLKRLKNKIVKVTPNSESAKQIMAERAAKQKKDLEFKKNGCRSKKNGWGLT
jgi:hypothetical protein